MILKMILILSRWVDLPFVSHYSLNLSLVVKVYRMCWILEIFVESISWWHHNLRIFWLQSNGSMLGWIFFTYIYFKEHKMTHSPNSYRWELNLFFGLNVCTAVLLCSLFVYRKKRANDYDDMDPMQMTKRARTRSFDHVNVADSKDISYVPQSSNHFPIGAPDKVLTFWNYSFFYVHSA